MKLDAFDYDLPSGRIATQPARPREAAKLLDMTSASGFADRHMRDFPDLCQPGDVIVVNNTSVIPARLTGYRGAAKISVTLHKCEITAEPGMAPGFGSHWQVFAKPARKCRPDDIAYGIGLLGVHRSSLNLSRKHLSRNFMLSKQQRHVHKIFKSS